MSPRPIRICFDSDEVAASAVAQLRSVTVGDMKVHRQKVQARSSPVNPPVDAATGEPSWEFSEELAGPGSRDTYRNRTVVTISAVDARRPEVMETIREHRLLDRLAELTTAVHIPDRWTPDRVFEH